MTFCCLLMKESLPERRKEEKGKSPPVPITSRLAFISVSSGGTEGHCSPGFCFVFSPRRADSMVARCKPWFWEQWCSDRAVAYLYHKSFTYECLFFLKQKFISGQDLRIQK